MMQTNIFLLFLVSALVAVSLCQPQPQALPGIQVYGEQPNGETETDADGFPINGGDIPAPDEHRWAGSRTYNCRGQWEQWGRWSKCDADDCDESGWQYKTRACGSRSRCRYPTCSGWGQRFKKCSKNCTTGFTKPGCEKNVIQGNWGTWGCWSEKCINNQRVRYRQCDSPWPVGTGMYCREGLPVDSKPCGKPVAPSTAKPCAAGQDIIFALDSSGSIGNYNYDLMTTAIIDLVTNFPNLDTRRGNDPSSTRVGILTFSGVTEVQKQLNNFTIPDTRDLRYQAGSTNTELAIQRAETMFTQANGDRSQNSNVLVVLTDGQSNDRAATINAANQARQKMKIIAFGIGENYDQQELEQIADDPATDVYDISTFDRLRTVLTELFSCT